MKRTTVLFALLCAVIGLLALPAGATTRAPAATERLPALEESILARLNATRTAHGLRPLILSDELRSAAIAHSHSMLEDGYFQHESKNGSPFFERVKTFYRADGYTRWAVGENLLYNTGGTLDAGSAIDAWLTSPAHRDNMLASGWREVGIGALHAAAAGGTFGGDPTWIVTMDFGARTGGKTRQLAVKQKPKKARKATTRIVKPALDKIERVLPMPAAGGVANHRAPTVADTAAGTPDDTSDEPDVGFESDSGFDLTR